MRLLRFRDWPLRLKVLFSLLVASTVPMAITLVVAYQAGVNERRAVLKQQGKAGAILVAAQIDEALRSYQRLANLFARGGSIIAYFTLPEDKKQEVQDRLKPSLRQRVAEDPALRAMAILDERGRVVMASDENLDRALIRLPHVNAALESGVGGIDDVQFTDLYPNQPAEPVIPVTAVVKSEQQKVLGLIVLWVKLDGLNDILKRNQSVAGPGSFIAVLDREGIRIGHSIGSEAMFKPTGPVRPAAAQQMIQRQRFGSETEANLNAASEFPEQHQRALADQPDEELFEGRSHFNNRDYVGVARRLDTVRWTVFVMMPRGDINKPVVALLLRVVYWCTPVVLLGLVAGMVTTGWMLKPVRALSQALRRIGTGDLSSRVAVESHDELGELADGFNNMADQLAQNMQALNEREARIHSIVDSAADGLVTVNERGAIDSFNGSAERMFAYRAHEVIGKNLATLLAGEERDWDLAEIQQRLNAGEATLLGTRPEVECKRQDGGTFPAELAVAEAKGNGLRVFTASFYDLTRRKQAEEELRKARDAAEQANRAKDHFLATMSHELRTPLNAIKGYSEMWEEEARETGNDQLRDDLQKIIANAKHLRTLIDDILDWAKIGAGKIEPFPETFDVAAMIRDTVATIRPIIEKPGNRLEVVTAGELETMHSDVTRIRQCLLNLLSNAGKFTKQGTITLEVRREKASGTDWVTFIVRDSGIGMTPEQLSRMFKPFEQADASTTRVYGGTGLGLAISQKLSQMMGGTIDVASVAGQGSTFTMRLPAEIRAATPPPAPQPVPPGLIAAPPGATILVVDDDPTVCNILERFLTGEGFHVVTCNRGEDVVRLAKEVRPQAITLDVLMPNMDGWSVLAALKNDRHLADIPVVMLSIVDDRNLGYALGASEYLTKPLDRDRLIAALKKYCKSPQPGLALVVEDEATTRDILRRVLEKDGWEVEEAPNGRMALDCVRNRKPALILLDLMMPEMDGFEFIAELRQDAEAKAIPVVVLTAKELTREDRLFLNGSLLLSGCVKRVMHKGKFSRDELLREVRNLVSVASS